MRAWLGKGFWRPSDLSEQALVVTMTPVFVPFWVFGAKTHTFWTADTSQTPAGARASWFPVAGEHRGHHAGLLVGASGALSARETMELCPFDLNKGVPPEQVDLENITVESFGLDRKFARPLARQGLEEREREACRQYVPGNARNVKVNIRLEGLTSEPMLLPVWIMAYRYREEVFRFLLNGQTGRATGHAPTSWRKIAAVIGISIGGILALIALVAIVAAIAAAF